MAMEHLLWILIALVAIGHYASWTEARKVRSATEFAANLVALELKKFNADTREQLSEIYHKVDGRLDLALDKVTGLEIALAKERGVPPPTPNPLAASTIPPKEE